MVIIKLLLVINLFQKDIALVNVGGFQMLIIDSREKEGSKLVRLVEERAKILNIQTEKKWLEI